jgi:hypothetical protein
VLETLQHLQRLTQYGVAYRSFPESSIDSLGPFRDVVISLLAALARQERIRLSERVVAGLARAQYVSTLLAKIESGTNVYVPIAIVGDSAHYRQRTLLC